ncbi:LLM class flavin-dependent oxidoreductase [Mycolicibacterium litorale]|uniref:LLM class flavin-dependent oxidoreductase n=1 Tax=Mycolicibacterium litorale TaxID=758802 RepID=UPI003CF1C674
MKIGILQEGEYTGSTVEERYHEIIEEMVLADKMGFSVFGSSEQHFEPPKFSIPAPEVLYAAIAMRTERIKLRPMGIVALSWNNPILVAERLAALDILSRGRAELCTARSNNAKTLRMFGVDPSKTRDIWTESMDALEAIFANPEAAEYHGEHWDFPQTSVVPTMVGSRYPAISVAASSVESHGLAAKRGIGAISWENYFGFDYLQECFDAYQKAIPETTAQPGRLNNYLGVYVGTAFCAPTTEEAREVAGEQALEYFRVTLDMYRKIAQNPGYEYMSHIDTMLDKGDDLDWLCESTSSVMIGTPDDYIRRLKDLEARGVDEVLLRIDTFGHKKHMECIELIGREVIPAVS